MSKVGDGVCLLGTVSVHGMIDTKNHFGNSCMQNLALSCWNKKITLSQPAIIFIITKLFGRLAQ